MAPTTNHAPKAAPLPAPDEYAHDADALLTQTNTEHGAPWAWTPMWHCACSFGPAAFDNVMQNLIRNPNVLSSWLFRADMLGAAEAACSTPAVLPVFAGLERADDRTVVRRLVPRNTLRDQPMTQTCLFYGPPGAADDEDSEDAKADGVQRALVVYLPHVDDPAAMPFYHPKVQGVGFLHEWSAQDETGTFSVHFAFFPRASYADAGDDLLAKLSRPVLARVALNLTTTVCKHGEGQTRGYTKRVHHDRLVSQARVQDRYTRLKEAHARRLVDTWQEVTDPGKHVFEDLAIAAFLIELWADMYPPGHFPGFVDVGCGNGLLVHVLNAEGYAGWGFDARARRSWEQYGNAQARAAGNELPIKEMLLLPHILTATDDGEASETDGPSPKKAKLAAANPAAASPAATHDGRFARGTFIVANHADELTVWTPLLAAMSGCAFMAIPCCSHNFTGAKFRAPPPSGASKAAAAAVSVALASTSTYASFVEWVVGVARDCGWAAEHEMLRIPSTRNVGIVGRRAASDGGGTDRNGLPVLTVEQAWAVVQKHGGAHGFADTVAKLAAETKKSH